MKIAVLFGSLALLILLSVPIGFAIGMSTVLTLIFFSDIPLVMVSQNAIAGVDSFPLMAIPFFVLAGQLMTSGGVARRLLDVAMALVGFVTGGLGMVATVASMFFSAISGSSLATCSAISSFMIPAMIEKGYDDGLSAAICASAANIGVIIPPSIPFVIYGVVTGTSIGDLFLAGIIPGILMGLSIIVVVYLQAKKLGYKGTGKWEGFRHLLKTVNEAKWALIAPLIVLGGIYGGIFTPTEAAVIAVVYSFIVGFFIYRELTLERIYQDLVETATVNGIITFMIGLSTAFASFLSMEQIPSAIAQGLLGITDNPILLLLLINLFLLALGCIIDNIPATIILSPILLPVVMKCGVDPITFGVVITANLAVGFVTPPYGPNLFVASAVSGVPMDRILKWIWPLVGAMFAVVLLITYVPGATMLLVNLFS